MLTDRLSPGRALAHQRRTSGLPRLVTTTLAAGALALALGCGSESTAPDESGCSDAAGIICTWAGTGSPGWNGDGRPLAESHLYWPVDLAIAPSGEAYVLDWNNHRVRQVMGGTFTTIIGTDFVGDGPDDQSDLQPPGAPGTTINLNHPTHVLPMPDGTLLLTAWHNHKLRVYDPSTGLVFVSCGGDPGFAGDGGPMRDALLSQPTQTIMGPNGALFVLDQRNQRVRRIDPVLETIDTVVGTGEAGFGGDGGDPTQAQLNMPAGANPPPAGALAFDTQGRLYISDTLNQRVRRVDFAANTIETIAGNGGAGYDGDGGPATAAELNNPRDIAFGPDGRLYIADELNNVVRAVDLDTGIITTVAGTGAQGFAGDGGPAVDAQLYRPAGLEFDSQGRLYIVDTYNHRIRRVGA